MKIYKFLLFPFGVLYFLVTYVRNKLYDFNVFKSVSFKIPLIGVGNLSTGGTGKTPMVEYLIRNFSKKNNTVLISRGYKRSTKGYVRANSSSTPDSIGDEPFQIFNKFKNITTVVDSNRVRGVSKILIEAPKTDLVLLDDCFQHRKINLKISIILTTYHSPFYNDFIIPVGNLREQKNNYNRADIIVVTKCPELISKEELAHIGKMIKPYNYQNLFFTKIDYYTNLFIFTKERFNGFIAIYTRNYVYFQNNYRRARIMLLVVIIILRRNTVHTSVFMYIRNLMFLLCL